MDGDWARDGCRTVRSCVDPCFIRTALDLVGERDGLVPLHLHKAVVALARTPTLVAAASGVLGPHVQIFSACFVVKGVGSDVCARWHQDGGTWPLSSLDAATAWVALDDAGPASGGLEVAPGSHRRGLLPHTGDETSLFGVGIDADIVQPVDPVELVLRAGDVSLHHPLLLHRSGPNTTARRRPAFIVRYVAADVTITADGWPPLVAT